MKITKEIIASIELAIETATEEQLEEAVWQGQRLTDEDAYERALEEVIENLYAFDILQGWTDVNDEEFMTNYIMENY